MCPHKVIIGMVVLPDKNEKERVQSIHSVPVVVDRSASIESVFNLDALVAVFFLTISRGGMHLFFNMEEG